LFQFKQRKRKVELNTGELEAREYHSKIVERISEVHRKLILKAKEMKYIEEKNESKAKSTTETEDEQPTADNNQSARQAARTRQTDTALRDVCLTETPPTKSQSPIRMMEQPGKLMVKLVIIVIVCLGTHIFLILL
jgi:hypothetical protein